MKFACDKCNTRYSIADERVRGRVLKIRCKACNHVITVREEQAEPLNESFSPGDEHTMVSTAPPAARDDAADEWFVSFDGEQEGPLPLQRAIDRVRSERPSGKECYCWRTGFFVWLPIEDVPEFAPALAPSRPLPPPPLPASVRATGSHAVVKSPSGSQAAVKSPSGSQAAVGKATGSQAAVGKATTGSQAAVGKTTGSQAVVGKGTGSNPAVGGGGGGGGGKATGSQPAIGRSAAPLPAIPPTGAQSTRLPAPAFELPGFDSGPIGTPHVAMPTLPTKPEPRVARREEAHATVQPLPSMDSGPSAVSPFAAALQAAGPTQVSGAPSAEANEPRIEQRLDTGPVPLPPPPGDDLPIGEASGLISLAHISKAAMTKPATPGKSFETFGGMPIVPSSHSPIPASAIMAAPGAAPGSAPVWMKWAALAGGVATIGLGVVVVVLLTRKPTVIVVPPAPQLDDNRRMGDQPILIADPGPNANPNAPQPGAADNEPNKRGGNKQHARSAKPQAKSPGDEKLNGEQGKLAALYRDDGEHAVPQNVRGAERGGAGGNVSQQAIMAVVTQNRRSLNLCYDRVLKHDSSLKSGRVLTHVKIGISGSVTGVNVPDPQYATSEIGQCIAQTIKRWHFPSADSEYETEFPIILQAN